MNSTSTLQQLDQGMTALGVKPRKLLLPAMLGAIATLSRVAALSSFLPMVHVLFAEGNRLGRLSFLGDYLPLEYFSLPVILSAMIVFFATMGALCSFLSNFLETNILKTAECGLQEKVFQQYLSFGQSYHDRIHISKSAVQMRRIPQQTTRLVSFLCKHLRSSLGFMIYIGGMLILSWQLALVVFACFALYFLAFGGLSSRLEALEAGIENVVDDANVEAQDILSNASLIRHSLTRDQEIRRWGQYTESIATAKRRKQNLASVVDPALNFFGVIILLGVVLGASTVIGAVEAHQAVRYLIFFLFFRRAINAFSKFLRMPGEWGNVQRDLDRFFDVLDDSNKGKVVGGDAEFPALLQDIQLRDLTFHYPGKKKALSRVNATIPHNRFTMVVGPSGSGKSTFIKLMLREYQQQSGDIFYNGISTKKYSTDSILQHTGFLGRDAQLFSNSIEYNLRYGNASVSDSELDCALQAAQCQDIIEKLPQGLQTDMGDHGNLFSSGERQRIALARLLLRREASLLLLDEATSAVDGNSELAIIDSLLSLDNTTIVLVAHRLSAIRADMHVLMFDQGEVVEQGRCDELLSAKGVFRQLWDSQNLSLPTIRVSRETT